MEGVIVQADLEGFTGTQLTNIAFTNDVMLLIILLLLLSFAVIYRLNTSLLGKMISDINAGEQRQSIFGAIANERFLFNAFMIFQALFLCSFFIFSTISEYKYITNPDLVTTFKITGILLFIMFIFFLFKKLIYAIFGYIFADTSATKFMLTNHQALFCIWGVSLYLPVLWILLVGKYFLFAIITVIICYLAFRAILIFKFLHMFFNKKTGLLFLSLYLCAQEIVPLVFLYEGLFYIYNIIEKNNI